MRDQGLPDDARATRSAAISSAWFFACSGALALASLCLLADPALAARPLTGTWAVRIVQPATGCDWTGVVRLVERDRELSGRGSANPSPGARRCPRLEGEVNGDVRGAIVRFGFGTGPLGQAQFEGKILEGGDEMNGSWSTRSASGQWAAGR